MTRELALELPPELAAALTTVINPRARRLTLRLEPAEGRIILVRPKRCNEAAIRAFVASRIGWIARQLQQLPPKVIFADGAVIPYLGENHTVRWDAAGRGGVCRKNGEIIVTGRAEHTARRLKDWLRAEARRLLTSIVHAMTADLARTARHVTVRDTRSRWGSCSRDGRLSFSWRLILAPESVFIYVAAHEVAHLVHLNHSRAFWHTVAMVLERYGADAGGSPADVGSARQWLRRRGAALYRYG